eukprot:NODE_9614_length_511_cov_25.687500_g9591_i0.p2 GENE.NODE_9614_length_511_cov_25.687500_g9591_i0~~NODE_9614_length_511_cov_25.687500_g9591_i0.p2  ORF type:complete len:127 (+),score=32.17 NODE_9614_length_511_cov_25.687500_g9591_i0:64-444(+)
MLKVVAVVALVAAAFAIEFKSYVQTGKAEKFVATSANLGANFTQEICQDSKCQNCTSHSFPQDTCLGVTGGGSAKIHCQVLDMKIEIWKTSTSCAGNPDESGVQPIDICLQDTTGSYLKNVCPKAN